MNEKKTRIVNLKSDDSLDILGYNVRLGHGDINRLHLRPSDKFLKSVRQRIRKITSRERLYHSVDGIIAELNPVLRGWKQYLDLPM